MAFYLYGLNPSGLNTTHEVHTATGDSSGYSPGDSSGYSPGYSSGNRSGDSSGNRSGDSESNNYILRPAYML